MKKEEEKRYIEKEKILQEIEYAFVKEFVDLRHEKKLTQQEMADQANVIRETIARIENQMTSPQVNTLIKILEPIGYTIKIVPINEKR
jgi:transcriptional regulator with XRE-family HTH domain